MWSERLSKLEQKRGRLDTRDPFEHDKTRVIHCPAFRRLQSKTQILGTSGGDFHRTRLTHSLEVASIGASILRHITKSCSVIDGLNEILPSRDLIETICLLHDIGHPPFGHGGEAALNYMMIDYGGFEGNAQTLRLITKIDRSYGAFGLDLTRRVLLGILKYPVMRSNIEHVSIYQTLKAKPIVCINDWLPPKAYYDSEADVVAWLLEPFTGQDKVLLQTSLDDKSLYYNFDCSIMDLADDIAYGVHDLEDAVHLNLIKREHFESQEFYELLQASNMFINPQDFLDALFAEQTDIRKRIIGTMVNYFITEIFVGVTTVDFSHPLLKYNAMLSAKSAKLLQYLIKVIYDYVINSQEARIFEYGGQNVIKHIFTAIDSSPLSLLDNNSRRLWSESNSEILKKRVISDYIANMTDVHAYQLHGRLVGFNRVFTYP
jgi:dGTPase